MPTACICLNVQSVFVLFTEKLSAESMLMQHFKCIKGRRVKVIVTSVGLIFVVLACKKATAIYRTMKGCNVATMKAIAITTAVLLV